MLLKVKGENLLVFLNAKIRPFLSVTIIAIDYPSTDSNLHIVLLEERRNFEFNWNVHNKLEKLLQDTIEVAVPLPRDKYVYSSLTFRRFVPRGLAN
jgi:hypothetical protein